MTRKSLICILILHLVYCGQSQEIDSIVTLAVERSEVLRKQNSDYAGAIAILQSTLDTLREQEGVKDLSLVPLYHKLGVNYYVFGKYLEAIPVVSKALVIRERSFGPVHIDVAKGYYLRAILNRELQLYDQAQQDFEAAIFSMEKLLETGMSNDVARLIRMFKESILLHTLLRNNALALQFWNKTYDYYTKNEEANCSNIITLYDFKGRIYYNQKKFDFAEQAYTNAIQLFEKYDQPRSSQNAIPAIYSLLGVMQFQQGKYDEAAKNYKVALSRFERLLEENETPRYYQELGVVYANLLELSGKKGSYEEANYYYEKALKYFLKGHGSFFHPNIASLYRDHAQIELERQHISRALVLNQKSIHALIPDFISDDPLAFINLNEYVVKDKISFLETLRQRADLLKLAAGKQQNQKLQYLKAAYQNYLTLDTVVTQIRQSYNVVGSQFDLIEQSYSIYEQAIDAALSLAHETGQSHYQETAYYFAARNKALVLLGGIQEQQARAFSSIPVKLQEQEEKLKKSIFDLEIVLYDLAVKGNIGPLKDSLFSLQRTHQKLIDYFETTYPDYYAYKYGFDQGVELEEFHEKLEQGTAVVEYFVGKDQLFVFVITKDGFDYYRMKKPADFDEKAWSFREQVQGQQVLLDSALRQSNQLYQWLLDEILRKPIVSRNIDHLVIIPDGVLIQLPFDILITDLKRSPLSYLLKQYAISYAYSNRLLFGQNTNRTTTGTFAGFGLEYDDYTLADLSIYTGNSEIGLPLSRALGKLQYADDEVLELSDLLAGDHWVNANATRSSFLKYADQYAILHLAMHGILNEESPMNSALVFNRQNDSTEYLVRATDLYNMKLNADMTVLSACNTGAGALQKGEGVRSLARTFFYAGCPSLVASLWNASDKSTKEILLVFYQNLKAGMTKHEAMRQAKLTYLDNAPPAYQSPYYWSHLSVIGDSSELDVLLSSSLKEYAFLLTAAMVLLGGFILWFWRSR